MLATLSKSRLEELGFKLQANFPGRYLLEMGDPKSTNYQMLAVDLQEGKTGMRVTYRRFRDPVKYEEQFDRKGRPINGNKDSQILEELYKLDETKTLASLPV